MKTECNAKRVKFQGLDRREVIGQFDGGMITSDAGALLLRETERRTGILKSFSQCFTDFRDPERIDHTVLQLASQRVYGLALGYEDLNDHDRLRHDQLLAVLCGKPDPTGEDRNNPNDKGKPLAGKSTLNRLELTRADANKKNRYKKIVVHDEKIDDLFVDVFVNSHGKIPQRIILDVDATDDPLHGHQEGRFFHGYYKAYCYLPLYIFCEDHLLCARLRPAGIDGAAGTVEELDRIVKRIRAGWPEVQIIIRGDSGFCREQIMAWCEKEHVDFVLGLAKNSRLNRIIEQDLVEAEFKYRTSGRASRIYNDFEYQTRKSWSRSRRVISKAEYLPRGANPRYVVTSLSPQEASADVLYEKLYCARGDMENRIKEQQLYLFADRTSTAKMRSNQLRLYFSSIAYLLLSSFRRLALTGTSMAKAQCHTIREKLFKIGAKVKVTVRKVWVSLAESYPNRDLFLKIHEKLTTIPV
jgi:hypothetical protein